MGVPGDGRPARGRALGLVQTGHARVSTTHVLQAANLGTFFTGPDGNLPKNSVKLARTGCPRRS